MLPKGNKKTVVGINIKSDYIDEEYGRCNNTAEIIPENLPLYSTGCSISTMKINLYLIV